jgi:hypothetical protein
MKDGKMRTMKQCCKIHSYSVETLFKTFSMATTMMNILLLSMLEKVQTLWKNKDSIHKQNLTMTQQ